MATSYLQIKKGIPIQRDAFFNGVKAPQLFQYQGVNFGEI